MPNYTYIVKVSRTLIVEFSAEPLSPREVIRASVDRYFDSEFTEHDLEVEILEEVVD
jgi:hypothetical protein